MALIEKGIIYGTGGTNLTISADMVLNSATYTSPISAYLPDVGTYTNCAKYDNNTLTISNPGADGTFIFSLTWTMNEVDWYTNNVSGILLSSFGANNISLLAVRNKIGETSYNLSTICASSLVNRYAEYCPDGNSPYRLGDFRWYAHSTPGGSKQRYTIGSTTVAWGLTQTIRAYGSRVFKEISGKPFATSRIAIFKGAVLVASAEANFTTDFGAYCSYTTPTNDKFKQGTSETYYIKTQHYNGASWVDGDSSGAVVVTYAAMDYTRISIDIAGDTATLTFTGVGAKFVVNGFETTTISGSPAVMEVSGPEAFTSPVHWYLYDEVGPLSGNWVLVDNGTVTW